jgi:nucleoside-diphosphate-sugar epimerase
MFPVRLKPRPFSYLSRTLADFLMVQTCLILTLVGSWIRGSGGAPQGVLMLEARAAVNQYFHLFLPVALLFPCALFLSGVYKDHANWPLSRRIMVLCRGITIAVTLFLTACTLLLPEYSLGVRTTILFCIALFAVLSSARVSGWLVVREASTAGKLAPTDTAKPVLVIGGAGYIGSILVGELLKQGRSVRVLDSLVYGDGALREFIRNPNLELIVGDCRNLRTVSRAVSGTGSIVHLAAIVGDPACAQDARAAQEVNYAATRMLIEVAKGHEINQFLFASSCSVYGASDELMSETSPVRPISVYAQTKVDSEQALLQACTERFQPTILRFATVFGLSPRPRFDLVVNLLTAKACQGHPLTIFNGEQWRPFIHVRDVVDALLCVLNAPLVQVGGRIFNVGDDRLNYTLTQVAESILEVFPEASVQHAPVSDFRNYRVSFDEIRTRLGFECARTLNDGILEIRNAFIAGWLLDYENYQYSNQKFLKLSGSPLNQDDIDENVMAAFAKPSVALPTPLLASR